MRNICMVNQKSRVGKTASVVNIGAGLARLGNKVLLVDLDPQAHLSAFFGLQANESRKTIYGILKRELAFNEVLIERKGLRLIPASLDLDGIDSEFLGEPGREFLLRESFSNLSGFDFVIFDCPPSLGFMTLNALTASTEIFIPLPTDSLGAQDLNRLHATVLTVQRRLNRRLGITGIIATHYDKKNTLCKDNIQKIQWFFGERLFKSYIGEHDVLVEACRMGKTIFEHRPNSQSAKDYLALSREILRRKGQKWLPKRKEWEQLL